MTDFVHKNLIGRKTREKSAPSSRVVHLEGVAQGNIEIDSDLNARSRCACLRAATLAQALITG